MMCSELSFDTKNLKCIPLAEQHHDDYCALYTDSENMHFIGSPLTRTKAKKAFLKTLEQAQNHPDKNYIWAIHQHQDNRFCGIIGLTRRKSSKRDHCGIILLKHARYKGYNMEASVGMLDTVFKQLPLSQVFASHAVNNRVVGKMLIRLGFQKFELSTSDSVFEEQHYSVTKMQYFAEKDQI